MIHNTEQPITNTPESRPASILLVERFAFLAHPAVLVLLLGVVAFLLRVVDLGGFVNEDEIRYWLPRSQTFLKALRSGDFAATAITTHPGVTTMWLGSIGILLRRMLVALDFMESVPFPLRLALMRLPVAIVHTAAILLGYRLLRRMLPTSIAFLAAFLWATDPFILAFSRILHVDGLAMTFGTLSVLALCSFWQHGARLRWLLLSGVFAGLAILSKSPALVLIAIPPLVALLDILHRWQQHKAEPLADAEQAGLVAFLPTLLKPVLARLALWGGACIATMLLVWPAFWVNPGRVYELMRVGVEVEGGSPHVQGNYFLGEENNEPGWLFYPVALALRTTPWTLLGILLLPVAWQSAAQQRLRHESKHPSASTRTPLVKSGQEPRIPRIEAVVEPLRATALPPPEPPFPTKSTRPPASLFTRPMLLPTLAVLAGFILLFVFGLSLFPKKLNRYLIPIFPAVDILAAAGLLWFTQTIQQVLARRQQQNTQQTTDPTRRFVMPLVTAIFCLIALFNAAWYHPYGVAYFNQALGGPPMGAWAFLIGSGEGLEQVADWLNEQPDITGVVTVTTMPPPLQPYLKHGGYAGPPDGDELPDKTGYVAVYVRNVWGHALPPFDQFYQRVPPVHQVTIHGVNYAWIYQVPQTMPYTSEARFGDTIGLHGYDIDTSALRSSGQVSVTLQWDVQAPINERYMLFVHVLNEQGERIAQIDAPPGGTIPTDEWNPHGYVQWTHPLPLPPDLPPGTYWIAIGLYQPDDFTRLPLQAPPRPSAPDDGANALFLEPIVIE
jgi:4-amino-4-deoxy-L-arabinose transferase-like glycosyltransferase